jgi:hypothetical protein
MSHIASIIWGYYSTALNQMQNKVFKCKFSGALLLVVICQLQINGKNVFEKTGKAFSMVRSNIESFVITWDVVFQKEVKGL